MSNFNFKIDIDSYIHNIKNINYRNYISYKAQVPVGTMANKVTFNIGRDEIEGDIFINLFPKQT